MSKKYTAHQIAKDTYLIEEKTAINQGLCYLLLGTQYALLIDTGLGYAGLDTLVRELTALPVKVANTHGHVDHIGGNHYFAEVWLHEKDRDIFTMHTDPNHTLNMLTEGMPPFLKPVLKILTKQLLHVDASGEYHYFGDDHVFCLGGREIEVIPTPGHTPGSVCFLDREKKMLFSGDTVCEQEILLHFKGEGCPPEVFCRSMEQLIAMEDSFDTVWPGHHGYPVGKDYIREYLDCVRQIISGTARYEVGARKYAVHGRIKISLPKE